MFPIFNRVIQALLLYLSVDSAVRNYIKHGLRVERECCVEMVLCCGRSNFVQLTWQITADVCIKPDRYAIIVLAGRRPLVIVPTP